jgi:U6 snRNA-associated Sm-like protein LSm1
LELEDDIPLQQVTVEHLLPFHKQELEEKRIREAVKAKILLEEKGFSKEGGEGDGY